jgi:ABC-2 type transport system ATP-binding protein
MTTAIAIYQLNVTRGGVPVLRDVTVNSPAGRITGLLGPSGSGKSTLMRAIVGVQSGVRGRLEILGQSAGSPPLRARIGYVTQTPSVYADLTVHENLDYFRHIFGAPRERIDEVLETVDLVEFAGRETAKLSGGQRARVSLAAAQLQHPDVLVLDEPTVGLDPVLREQLWATFNRLADGGAPQLVSSHVMDEAERCHDLILLREGRVLATGTPDELRVRTDSRNIEGAFLNLVRNTPEGVPA